MGRCLAGEVVALLGGLKGSGARRAGGRLGGQASSCSCSYQGSSWSLHVRRWTARGAAHQQPVPLAPGLRALQRRPWSNEYWGLWGLRCLPYLQGLTSSRPASQLPPLTILRQCGPSRRRWVLGVLCVLWCAARLPGGCGGGGGAAGGEGSTAARWPNWGCHISKACLAPARVQGKVGQNQHASPALLRRWATLCTMMGTSP